MWGILHGSSSIPEAWRRPVGEAIRNVAIANFQPPATLPELTERTVRMARRVLLKQGAPVEIREEAPTDLSARTAWSLEDAATAQDLWTRSPYRLRYDFVSLQATLDLVADPEIEAGIPRLLTLFLENQTPQSLEVTVAWHVPPGLKADPARQVLTLPPPSQPPQECQVVLTATEIRTETVRGSVEIAPVGRPNVGLIPFALAGRLTVSQDDLALIQRGATAASDSELDWEPGCTLKAIDGVIASADDFESQRWHSALTPHPHWIAVSLPEPRSLAHVVIHFADPAGYPVDFGGQISSDGETWRTVFQKQDYGDPRRYERDLVPVEAQYFRLLIHRSASLRWPDAAQISEIEWRPPPTP